MFYSQHILTKKGPLAKIWLAAHMQNKLTKAMVFGTDVSKSCEKISEPDFPMALRLTSSLLLGVVRIHSRKARYLLADCGETMARLKVVSKPTQIELPVTSATAPFAAVTLMDPDAIFNYNDIDVSLLDYDLNIPGGGLLPQNQDTDQATPLYADSSSLPTKLLDSQSGELFRSKKSRPTPSDEIVHHDMPSSGTGPANGSRDATNTKEKPPLLLRETSRRLTGNFTAEERDITLLDQSMERVHDSQNRLDDIMKDPFMDVELDRALTQEDATFSQSQPLAFTPTATSQKRKSDQITPDPGSDLPPRAQILPPLSTERDPELQRDDQILQTQSPGLDFNFNLDIEQLRMTAKSPFGPTTTTKPITDGSKGLTDLTQDANQPMQIGSPFATPLLPQSTPVRSTDEPLMQQPLTPGAITPHRRKKRQMQFSFLDEETEIAPASFRQSLNDATDITLARSERPDVEGTTGTYRRAGVSNIEMEMIRPLLEMVLAPALTEFYQKCTADAMARQMNESRRGQRLSPVVESAEPETQRRLTPAATPASPRLRHETELTGQKERNPERPSSDDAASPRKSPQLPLRPGDNGRLDDGFPGFEFDNTNIFPDGDLSTSAHPQRLSLMEVAMTPVTMTAPITQQPSTQRKPKDNEDEEDDDDENQEHSDVRDVEAMNPATHLNARTLKMKELLMNKLQEEQANVDGDLATVSINFSQMMYEERPAMSRRIAARSFYELLGLSTRNQIRVRQDTPYGDIYVHPPVPI